MKGKTLKNFKDIDINNLEKPKTLVILYYNEKRISMPLFKEIYDFPEMLYHHISKLEEEVFSKSPGWEKKANQQIVCFQIKKDAKAQKLGDGDLKSDILLSLIRIQGQQTIEELAFRTDMTKVYKFLQIEPYYRHFHKQLSPYQQSQISRTPYFTFYRIISSTANANTYLARKITDGYFFSIKVYFQGSRVGISEAKIAEHMAYIDQQHNQIKSSLLVKGYPVYIPHPEAESEEEEQNAESCRHVAIIIPYFVRGTLEDLLNEARYGRKKITQMDCLNYLKQLMWGIHLLHEKYNLIHRAINPSLIFIDQNGQLKLPYFAYSGPCYDPQGNFMQYTPKTKFSKPGFYFEQLAEEDNLNIAEYSAPQMIRGQFYNYLVDFYSIGVIVKKLYEHSQVLQRAPVSQNNQNLMMAMINKLTSNDLEERAAIANEILEDISREDTENQHNVNNATLTLHDIKVGKNIEISTSKKFIENQEQTNDIDHEMIRNFFKQPIKPKVNKIKKRKLSKEKTVKQSREKSEKSQKSHSKISENINDISHSKKNRKVSNSKNGSFKSDPHQTSKDSKDRNPHKLTNNSPAKSKGTKSKSKSQERKKIDPFTQTKTNILSHPHQVQKRTLIVPKSPKAAVLPRAKSPVLGIVKR